MGPGWRYRIFLYFLLTACAATAGPLPLPPGEVELSPLREVGAVTAVAYQVWQGERSPTFFIRPEGDGYGLFEFLSGEREPELRYFSPELAPTCLASGRALVIGLRQEGGTKLHFLGGEGPLPVTAGRVEEGSPAWSPDRRWLVFIAQVGGRSKLYGLRFGEGLWDSLPHALPYLGPGERGEGVFQLFPGPGEEKSPAFGPWGLAFLSNALGSWDLWLLAGDDLSRTRRVLPGVDPDSPLAWVGRQLLVAREGQVGLVPPDGSSFRPLVGPEGWWRAPGAPFFPVLDGVIYGTAFPKPLSPDFAVVRVLDRHRFGELWLGTVDGPAWKVAEGASADSVAWSPDGEWIAYIRVLPGSGDIRDREAGYCPEYYELRLARADGSEPRLLWPFSPRETLWCPGEVAWSPDGGRIYFGVAGSPTHREIWSVDSYGADLTYHTWGWDFTCHANGLISGITRGAIPFVYDPRTDEEEYIEDWGMIPLARFSPAADKLVAEVEEAVVLIDRVEGTAIPLLPASQLPPRVRGPYVLPQLQVSWRPDGAGFAFVSIQDGDAEIWYYDLASGTANKLTDNDWDDLFPSFSPDGDYLGYVSCRGPSPRVSVLSLADNAVLDTSCQVSLEYARIVWRLGRGG